MSFEIGKLTRLPLGLQGESNSRPIRVDVHEWLEEWPNAAVNLMVLRPGEDTFYTAAATVDNGVLTWTPTRADVLIAGKGMAQFILTDENDVELRSRVVETLIGCSIAGTEGEAPDPEVGWVQQVYQAAQDAEEAVSKMPTIGENGNWWLWDAETEAFVDSGKKAYGVENLVDGAAAGSVKHVQAKADGDVLTSDGETVYKQGARSLALGAYSAAVGPGSACLGLSCETHGATAFAAGRSTIARGYAATAFGMNSEANGENSFAANSWTYADGEGSASFGRTTRAAGPEQFVIGRQNVHDEDGINAFIIGNGDRDTNGEAYRSNAHTVDWEGNAWFAGEVKAKNLPKTTAPHQQLVTDSDGAAMWAPRLAYEYQVETELLPATALTYGGEAGGHPVHLLMTELAGEIEQGKVYAVTYNGAEYVCPVVYLPGETADQDGYILGKASVVGLEGGNDDAPFVLIRSVSYEENGYYALCLALDSAESVTISIKGEGTAYKTIDPKYLPDNRVVTAHVNLTKLTTTAIEFGECDMTFAQLWEAFSAGKEVRLLCSYEANGYYQTLCGTVDTSMAVDGSETVLRMTMPKSHFHEGLFYVGIGAGESGEAVFAQITFD